MSKNKAHFFSTGVLSDEPDSLQGYYAGFASRAVALIIDYLIIFLVGTFIVGTMTFFIDLSAVQRFIQWVDSILPGFDRLFIGLTSARFAGVLFLLVNYGYFVFFFSTTGQTIGKSIMGLRVVTMGGHRMGVKRSFIRALCYAVSLAPLGLGFLWVLGHDQRQAWHDRIARTYVLYVWDARYEENFLRNAVYQLSKKREERKVEKAAHSSK